MKLAKLLSATEALAATGGELLAGDPATMIDGISTDSRSIAPGELFVALVGESFDGHEFIPAALERGAMGALCSRRDACVSGRLMILVPDTLEALGRIAAHYRRQFDLPVAAITGSTGKTTVKEMLVSILGGSREVLKTPASHNNEVGVPLAVLALSPETDVAVLELAMRGPGQIAYLADICRPSVGVITNVGPSHLEFFADDAEIAAVKAELLAALPPDGAAVLNMDDRYFDFFRERSPAPVISFGISDAAAVRGVDVEPLDGWSWQFRLETAAGSIPIALRVPGRHQVSNALAAAAAALRLGASLEEVRAGLEAYTMVSHRVNLLASVRGITVIDDCYNASPVSMAAALDLLAGAPAARRIAVLGDMRELGEQTESFHRDLGGLAARVPVDRLVTVGELGALIAEGARVELASLAVETCADNAAAIETLLADMRPGDVVLVKGSRAMGMEEIVARLMAE